MSEDVGERVLASLGESGARELLEVLERSDDERAALIGRLHAREDARWLAELLMDLEDDVGEMVRLRLVDALRARRSPGARSGSRCNGRRSSTPSSSGD